MEKAGFNSCIDFLIDHGIPVTVITTDRSPSVIKEMKDNYPEIEHQFDIWHVAKSVKKKLFLTSKKNYASVLHGWIRTFVTIYIIVHKIATVILTSCLKCGCQN